MKQISTQRHQLAEGPFWSQAEQALYWVDIPACQVWRWHQESNECQHWTLPKKVSAVFTTQSERLLVCMADGVAYLDKLTGDLEYLCALDTDLPSNRSNDAKCDPNGTLWVGTMDDVEKNTSGRLWQVTAEGKKTLMLEGVGVANTLAWDEQRGRFYFGDSMTRQIHAFPYPEFYDIRRQKPFVEVPEGIGADGSCIDLEGCLWNANWNGARIVRYNPDGELLETIELPFAKPTSCVFGGPEGKTLFITSASVATSEEDLAKQPLAGHVFAIDLKKALDLKSDFEVDIAGAPSQPFAGG
ncbi:SMP-30/gluconolactonase/LRE family protein [Marinomonas transparens]|uniref:SMP-30/gluconolactonase/LRE family protein n=1 Tax=Marinomonas transparens TaxID=2795388 RepID=A0A934N3J0_9GAMM|nr:SMP-30/gluconolactonase/LRE family protein [Marinomonas transparens]MBJ7539048.1 SMP-30/gluconolactonase/LRE family protein [Marinomonas transparens]